MKRMLSILLVLTLMLSLSAGAFALEPRAEISIQDKADALYALGLLQGKGTNADGTPDYAFQDYATRNEAAAMLCRLLGKEQKSQAQYDAGALGYPFPDVSLWAQHNVFWLYSMNYVNGMTTTTYGGRQTVKAKQFAALLLRALDYSETAGDFQYGDALTFAVSKGILTTAEMNAYLQDFRRSGMISMCYNALSAHMKNSDWTLMEKLTDEGVFSGRNTAALAPKVSMGLTMKYSGGGRTGPWIMDEASMGAPLCGDLDGDGRNEMYFTAWNIVCFDGATGEPRWVAPSGQSAGGSGYGFGEATLPPRLLDVDGDGVLELVTFNTNYGVGTFVGVYNGQGRLKYNFQTPKPARAATVDDLDGDGRMEFCIGFGVGSAMTPSFYVYDYWGGVRPGWPVVVDYGTYTDGIETVDLDGDGRKELVLLNDMEYVAALHSDGTEVLASGGVYRGISWSGLPVMENLSHEEFLANWARNHGGHAYATDDSIIGPTRQTRNMLVGTHGGVVADDLDGDGTQELVFTEMVVDAGLVMRYGATDFENGIAKYFTAFILNRDRTRYRNAARGFDWSQIPSYTGEILCLDSPVMFHPDIRPVTADLDGDGLKEILYGCYDGKIHCWSLDKTEHGAWPFALDPRNTAALTFSTRPVAADLNGDGRQEVIFATYTQTDQTAVRGKVYVLDCTGRELCSATLPPRFRSDWDVGSANGARAVPCVADVDNDGRLEIAVTTQFCGVVVYEVEY